MPERPVWLLRRGKRPPPDHSSIFELREVSSFDDVCGDAADSDAADSAAADSAAADSAVAGDTAPGPAACRECSRGRDVPQGLAPVAELRHAPDMAIRLGGEGDGSGHAAGAVRRRIFAGIADRARSTSSDIQPPRPHCIIRSASESTARSVRAPAHGPRTGCRVHGGAAGRQPEHALERELRLYERRGTSRRTSDADRRIGSGVATVAPPALRSETKMNRQALALVPLRLMLGIGFIIHGAPKLFSNQQHGAFAGMLEGIGVPAAKLVAWLVGALEFFGGVGLILGFLAVQIAALLIINMLVALFTVHLRHGFNFINMTGMSEQGPRFGMPGYEVNLLYSAGLLAIVIGGAGAFSIDLMRRRAMLLRQETRQETLGTTRDPVGIG
jgi:putative oxidoreductase